jgi:S1-C subfamily serine protease
LDWNTFEVRRAVVALVVAALLSAGGASAAANPTKGVVDIQTVLGYRGGAAAGTGIVVSSSGEVVTNNHVIRGATRVLVTVPSTGKSYSATVVGYSLSGDVALLRLSKASGLTTATIGDSSKVKVGDHVTAVGNAGGRGGRPTVTTGTITALHRSITVSNDELGAARLTDLMETSAPLEPGDSGGPLLDDAGRVIGIDTAADTGFDFRGGGSGFAIPIARAISIAGTIRAGRSTANVHVGPTSFLGVSVSRSDGSGGITAGAFVSSLLPGSAADKVGIMTGDVITSLAGHAISSPASLVNTLLQTAPGKGVQIRWTDPVGHSHTATIHPAAGPPQ